MSSSSSCHFCARPNPAGSKFCNHCGEPVDLKPCKQCDAFNHIAVDRCYQCGTLFAPKREAFAVAETGVAGAVASPSAPPPRAAPSRPARVEPALGPLEHTPVALSDRMETYTERVAEHVSDAPPLMPFAEAVPEADDDDWVDPRRQWEARLESRARRRTRAVTAAVAAVVLCAIVAAGYVAYDSGWLVNAGAWARAAEQSVVASSSAMVDKLAADIGHERETAPPRSPGTPPAAGSAPNGAALAGSARRSGDSAAASASNPPLAQPATDAPAPLATKTLEDPTPSSGSAGASPSPAREATSAETTQTRNAPASAGKTARAARSDAPARRTTREAAAKPAHPAPQRPAVDKDALATQRLIQRDLAGFLPPEPPSPR